MLKCIRYQLKIKIGLFKTVVEGINSGVYCSFIRYRKPPNISPGLIFVRKHFLVGLYMGRLIYGGGLIYGQDFVLVILTIY